MQGIKSHFTMNTEQIESALLNKEIETGIVEGQSKNKAIKYTPFLKTGGYWSVTVLIHW
jgi:hypothetical protein